MLAEITARTKFQTGLAHIETLSLEDGGDVSVRIDALGFEARHQVDTAKPFVTVTLTDEGLLLDDTDRRPGYV